MKSETKTTIGIIFCAGGTALIIGSSFFGLMFIFGLTYGLIAMIFGGFFFASANTGVTKLKLSTSSPSDKKDYSEYFKPRPIRPLQRPSKEDKSKFCVYCGKPVQDGDDVEFCSYCGEQLIRSGL